MHLIPDKQLIQSKLPTQNQFENIEVDAKIWIDVTRLR